MLAACSRRRFLIGSAGAAAAVSLSGVCWPSGGEQEVSWPAQAESVIPVVGDGRWIWTSPPDGQRGYLEPRAFRATIGIELEGTGNNAAAKATTPVPVSFPEQRIEDRQIETHGAAAQVEPLAAGAAQLVVTAGPLAKGQRAWARVHDRLVLCKQYHGFQPDTFPTIQSPPADVARDYLGDSPGIETRIRAVRDLAGQLAAGHEHPWDRAGAFFHWVRRNIEPQVGPYTSVTRALETRRGDCEELAGVFIALCRAVGIPARLVWVPHHAWAEFYLTDHAGQGHWIAAHTACYSWFGYTGVHELVLQKGDRIPLAERKRQLRLLDDWLRYAGSKPHIRFTAELEPLADADPTADATQADPGPGHRRKSSQGAWPLVGNHPLNRYHRP